MSTALSEAPATRRSSTYTRKKTNTPPRVPKNRHGSASVARIPTAHNTAVSCLYHASDACLRPYSALSGRHTLRRPPRSYPVGSRTYTSSSTTPLRKAVSTSSWHSAHLFQAAEAKTARKVAWRATGAHTSL